MDIIAYVILATSWGVDIISNWWNHEIVHWIFFEQEMKINSTINSLSGEVQNNVQLTFTKYLNRNETLSKFMRTYISFHVKFCCHGHYITLFWVSLRDFQKNLDTGKLFCCVLYIKQQYKFYKLRPYVLIKYPLPM